MEEIMQKVAWNQEREYERKAMFNQAKINATRVANNYAKKCTEQKSMEEMI